MKKTVLRWQNKIEIKLWRAVYALEHALEPWLSVVSWSVLAWLIGILVGFTWRAGLP